MPVLNTNVPTLTDWAKRVDPDGKIASIVELLNQTNEVLNDMVWKEGNLPTGERTTVRTGLPSVYWRMINKGVPPSKSQTAQVDEQCGMLEARCSVDVELAKLNGNTAEFRLSEAMSFIEAMNQEMSRVLFYGDPANPAEFPGFTPRYSDLTANNARNIIDATPGGTGTNLTSIWLIVWSNNTVHGVFPKGSTAGLEHQDLGEQDEFDANGDRYRAYMDLWKWKPGLVVRDWRYAVRIANVDVDDLASNAPTIDLQKLMAMAIHRIPSLAMGRAAFYMNRTVAQWLDVQSMGRGGVTSTVQYTQTMDQQGEIITRFRGIPVRTVDTLANNEARVV